ncbi:MAG: outer membrane protein assembly factor BamB family protein [Pirellulales bacterium]
MKKTPWTSSLLFSCLLITSLMVIGCTPPPVPVPGPGTTGGGNNTTVPFNTTEAASPNVTVTEIELPEEEPVADLVEDTPVVELTNLRPSFEAKADPQDWTFWRGPEQNGFSRATGLPEEWDPEGGEGSNVLWKREDLGTRSTPVVMNGKLFTLCQAEPESARQGEKVVCLDAATGETLWENRFNVYLSDVPDTRVGWSAVVADPTTNLIYALGVCGHFQCINAETGKTIWLRKMHEEFGLLSTYGGRTNFPIIHEDLVIVSAVIIGWGDMAKPGHRFLAFNKITGKVVWFNGTRPLPYDTTYSSPSIFNIDGQAQMIFGSGDGQVWGFQPRTGKPIWYYTLSRRGIYGTPVMFDNTVFMAHGEENINSTLVDGEIVSKIGTTMGAVAAIDPTGSGNVTVSGQKWKIEEMVANRSTPLMINGILHLIDDRAKLHFLDPKTGESVAPRKALGTKMFSSPLYADGKIYTVTENGRFYILEPKEGGGVDILSKGRLPEGDSSLGSPICAQGRVYIPTTGAIYCLVDSAKEPGFSELPEPAKEASVNVDPGSEDNKPAWVQIVPAEVLLKAGETQEFKVWAYNHRGQRLHTDESGAELSLAGPGKLTKGPSFHGWTFTAAEDGKHTATIMTAKFADLTGSARVRVVPDLPWKFDFEDIEVNAETGKGEPPVTWVGARYRHQIHNKDGNNYMTKITTIPKGTRSRSWMGHPDMHDYTIEADVKGAVTKTQMPDIGLIAQGYVLVLNGNEQTLQIRSWVTQLRMAKSVEFKWDADAWYHLKFQASNEDGKAILRGKIWKKDEKEPDAWTIEAEDTVPNTSGSPGLFGAAKVAELYLDNIEVKSNTP